MPVRYGAELAGYDFDVPCLLVEPEAQFVNLDFVVLRIDSALHAPLETVLLPVQGAVELHAARHPYPRASILAEACAQLTYVPDTQQVHHGREVSALVALPAAGAPVGAAPETVNQGLVPASAVLRVVALSEFYLHIPAHLAQGGAGGETYPAVRCDAIGFNGAGFADDERIAVLVHRAPVYAVVCLRPRLNVANADAHAVQDDVVVHLEHRVHDYGFRHRCQRLESRSRAYGIATERTQDVPG